MKKVRLDSEAALLKTLSDHLRANELVAWIQEEALRRLAEDGSHHLAMLSQGRYALRGPYANRGALPAFRAAPHYTLECEGESAQLRIDEDAVRSGAELRGPDLCR